MAAKFTAAEIMYATNGRLCRGAETQDAGRIVWRPEEVKKGDWFLALSSAASDGHDQLDEALARGAQGCIVSRRARYKCADQEATLLAVADTKSAIFDLVRYWRYSVRPIVIGVSGTSERRRTISTLEDLLKTQFRCHTALMDNLNWLGCVEAALEMPADTQVLLFEAGAVERGDIGRIGGALDPHLAIITEVQGAAASSPERNEHLAAMYCEILETVQQASSVQAIIYDQNPAVLARAQEVINQSSAIVRTTAKDAAAKAHLWCATEAAKVLGLTPGTISQFIDKKPERLRAH